jgi:hypothetical protein
VKATLPGPDMHPTDTGAEDHQAAVDLRVRKYHKMLTARYVGFSASARQGQTDHQPPDQPRPARRLIQEAFGERRGRSVPEQTSKSRSLFADARAQSVVGGWLLYLCAAHKSLM